MARELGIEWPAALLERAVVAGSGEPLWAASELPAAIDWAERSSLAVVAIEVYGKLDLARGVFQRELPIGAGRGEDESWERYVTRVASAARDALGADLGSDAAGPADLYFLALIPEGSIR